MNYLLISINIILTIIIICHIYNNWFTIKEGLEGCPASQRDQEARRRRGASRNEINATIKDIQAKINQVRRGQSDLTRKIDYNRIKLEAVSKEASAKAKRNKDKMDKLK
tara:strand:+ start:2244 stop:2570 length:327 start_codon:yes stop_codon:yes gene_type:complete